MNDEMKAAVTVAEMARMCGLSRSRMYQLIGKAFPEPSRDESGRPYFNEDQQRTILEVRRRNCGIDGKPILFYAPRNSISGPTTKRRSKPKPSSQHAEIVEYIREMGATTATASQVERAIALKFPDGIDGIGLEKIITEVFTSICRQDSPNKPTK